MADELSLIYLHVRGLQWLNLDDTGLWANMPWCPKDVICDARSFMIDDIATTGAGRRRSALLVCLETHDDRIGVSWEERGRSGSKVVGRMQITTRAKA